MKYFTKVAMLIVSALFVFACEEKKSEIEVSKKSIVNNEVVAEKVEVVKPSVKPSVVEVPEKMTVQEKKDRFRKLLVPPTLKVYEELSAKFEQVGRWMEQNEKSVEIAKLKEEFRAETDAELLAALKPHPPSIVIAQAAMESAWATSRFTIKANNLFGVWSFDKNEPRIAAGEQRGEKTIWLKKYSSIEDSVRDNYRVLARSAAFKEFRELRMTNTNPYDLVKKLDRYSEKGAEYGHELASMISFNKFTEYDPVFHAKP